MPFQVEFKLVAMIDVSYVSSLTVSCNRCLILLHDRQLVHAIVHNQIAAGAEAMEQFKGMGMALTTLNCMFQMVGSQCVLPSDIVAIVH